MMVTEPIKQLNRDERGVVWIADSNVKVIEVAMDHAAYGWEAAEIHAAHPHLTLAQVHAALSYYYDHKAALDSEMQQQLEHHRQRRMNAVTPLTPTRAMLLSRLNNV